jgi:transglutaminase-like putative cysteine protease
MKSKTSKLLFLVMVLGCLSATAQEKTKMEFGKVTTSDFILASSSVIDELTGAVILADVGSTDFIGNDRNWYSYVFKRFVRIKIIHKNAFELATVKIRLYGADQHKDKLSNLKAVTYNNENGKVIESQLELKDVYEDKLNKSTSEEKFTLPTVKEGSIIEYTYTITSNRYYGLPSWTFQHRKYPTLYSEYRATIPNQLGYLMTQYGADSFLLKKVEQAEEKYVMRNVNVYTTANKYVWAMKDIPAFKEEEFIYSPQAYLDKLEFHLAQVYNGADLYDYASTWNKATDLLLADDQFGDAIPPVDFSNLRNIAEKVTKDDTSSLGIAKRIYYYIRDNFASIKDDDIFTKNDLYVVNKNRKGNVAEINLLLISLLRQKGIMADLVVLSTREYGRNSPDYPLLDKLNYVICMAVINGETIYLDAADPLLGFGRLSLPCYNGHARVVGQNVRISVYFNPDDMKEQKTILVNIKNGEAGQQTGHFESFLGYFQSEEVRRQIAGSDVNRYFDKVRTAFGKEVKVTNCGIDSLYKTELPVRVHYDLELPDNNDDIIYFSPIIGGMQKNWFQSDARKYPIEMPYPLDEEYVLTMEIPRGYEVDELPKSAQVSFNGDEGYFHYLIQKDGTTVQLRSHIKLNHAIFAATDYDSLRDFFAYILKKQSEQIVFKKKK